MFEGLSGPDEEELTPEEMQKLIDVGDKIEKIASGQIFASPEQRDAALALVKKFGGE